MVEFIYSTENVVWEQTFVTNKCHNKSELKYTNMKKVEEKGILSIHLLNSFVPGLQIQYHKQTICGLTLSRL